MGNECPECGRIIYGRACKCGYVGEKKEKVSTKEKITYYEYIRCNGWTQGRRCQHPGTVAQTPKSKLFCRAHFFYQGEEDRLAVMENFLETNPFSRDDTNRIKNDFGWYTGRHGCLPRFDGCDELVDLKKDE